MATDSRAKGARAETTIRDKMRELTGLGWERVPSSGALDPKHGLKGDLYIPNEKNLYVVEVKHYASSHIDHLLVSGKSHQLVEWVNQAIRQGIQVSKTPLLIFKHDRSLLYCAFTEFPEFKEPYLFISREGLEFYVSTLEDYIKYNKPKFII
jgi:hypothetical protein